MEKGHCYWEGAIPKLFHCLSRHGFICIKQSSSGCFHGAGLLPEVEDWATELNSLFSDKPSMSLVEASGTRWLMWLEIFGKCVGFWWCFFYGFGSTMGWKSPWFHHHFIKSWAHETAWMITFPMKNDEQRVATRGVLSTNQLFLKGLERGSTKKQHWTIENMLWWFEFVEEKGEMMEHQWLWLVKGFPELPASQFFPRIPIGVSKLYTEFNLHLSTRIITSNLVIILNNRTFWTSQLSSLWINFTQMWSCRTSSRCRFCRPFGGNEALTIAITWTCRFGEAQVCVILFSCVMSTTGHILARRNRIEVQAISIYSLLCSWWFQACFVSDTLVHTCWIFTPLDE